jgi:hypothetical protein
MKKGVSRIPYAPSGSNKNRRRRRRKRRKKKKESRPSLGPTQSLILCAETVFPWG